MYKYTQEGIPAQIHIPLTEVEIVRSLPRRASLQAQEQPQRWWNEERLALLALVLGNACFLGLVLWWIL